MRERKDNLLAADSDFWSSLSPSPLPLPAGGSGGYVTAKNRKALKAVLELEGATMDKQINTAPPLPPAPPAPTEMSMVPWSVTGTPWQADLTTKERITRALFPFGSSLSEDSATSLPRVGLTIAYWYLLYRVIKKVL